MKVFCGGYTPTTVAMGFTSSLRLGVSSTRLDSYPSNILSDIEYFDVSIHERVLLVVLPQMKKLTSLILNETIQIAPALLNVITRSIITALTVYSKNIIEQTSLFSIHSLINSPSSKLKDLNIQSHFFHGSTKPLCDVLFGPSSLTSLTLILPEFTESSFDLLETNTCLTTVKIRILYDSSKKYLPLRPLSKILQNNKTIEKLQWGHCNTLRLHPSEVESLNKALFLNTTLRELILYTNTINLSPLSSLIQDTRVKYI